MLMISDSMGFFGFMAVLVWVSKSDGALLAAFPFRRLPVKIVQLSLRKERGQAKFSSHRPFLLKTTPDRVVFVVAPGQFLGLKQCFHSFACGLIVDEQLTVRKFNPGKLFCPAGPNHQIIRGHGQVFQIFIAAWMLRQNHQNSDWVTGVA